MPAAPPPSNVLTDFNISDPPTRLPGGQGHTYRAGNWILKAAPNSEETEWVAETVEGLDQNGFRVARYQRATSGAWVVSGWSAQQLLEGEARTAAWPEIILAGQAFHRALADAPRPRFLDERNDPWAAADRFAWGEGAPDDDPEWADSFAPLIDRLVPVRSLDQVIHGDLTGNVLFHDGQLPAIVDITPYWRPPAFAAAIVMVDALTWEGADIGLLASVEALPNIKQCLLLAAIRRTVELEEQRRRSGRELAAAIARHRSTLRLLLDAFPEWR